MHLLLFIVSASVVSAQGVGLLPVASTQSFSHLRPPIHPGTVKKRITAIQSGKVSFSPSFPPYLKIAQLATVDDVKPLLAPEMQGVFQQIIQNLNPGRTQEYAKAKWTLDLMVYFERANKFLDTLVKGSRSISDVEFKLLATRYVNQPNLFLKIMKARNPATLKDIQFFQKNFGFLETTNPELFRESWESLKANFLLSFEADAGRANEFLDTGARISSLEFIRRYADNPDLLLKIIRARNPPTSKDIRFFEEGFAYLKTANPDLFRKSLTSLKDNLNKFLDTGARISESEFKELSPQFVDDSVLFRKVIRARNPATLEDIQFFRKNFEVLRSENPELFHESLTSLYLNSGARISSEEFKELSIQYVNDFDLFLKIIRARKDPTLEDIQFFRDQFNDLETKSPELFRQSLAFLNSEYLVSQAHQQSPNPIF